MSNFDAALTSLKETFFNDPLIKEFLLLREEAANAKDLIELEQLITEKKQALARAFNDDEQYPIAKKEYVTLKARFDNDPRVVNLRNLTEEVHGLLSEIASLLNENPE